MLLKHEDIVLIKNQ